MVCSGAEPRFSSACPNCQAASDECSFENLCSGGTLPGLLERYKAGERPPPEDAIPGAAASAVTAPAAAAAAAPAGAAEAGAAPTDPVASRAQPIRNRAVKKFKPNAEVVAAPAAAVKEAVEVKPMSTNEVCKREDRKRHICTNPCGVAGATALCSIIPSQRSLASVCTPIAGVLSCLRRR